MKKIKALFLGLIAALGLASCTAGSETAFVEQHMNAKLNESAVVVELPKKTEEELTDVKGYLQVKIKKVAIEITPYELNDEGKDVAKDPLDKVTLQLKEEDRFVDVAYAAAFELINLKSGDGEKLNYKLLDTEIGTPYHKGVALMFKINLDELAKINTYEVLKTAEHFKLKIQDKTTSAYSVIKGARPHAELDLFWDGEAFAEKEEAPAPAPEGGDSSNPVDSSEPASSSANE